MFERFDSWCLRDLESLCLWDLILDVWEIWFLMFERFDSLCLRDWCVINWISIWIYISRIVWFIHSTIILRLFLLSATSSLASPVHSYGGDARGGYFFTFLLPRLFSLLIIVSRLFRWAEMSHITTTGSYYSTSLFFTSFFMISLLSLFPNKIETIFLSLTYLTSWVFLVIRLGPDLALLFFVSVYTRCGAEDSARGS